MTPLPLDPAAVARDALRRAARTRRAALGSAERDHAAHAVRDRLLALPDLRTAHTIAGYAAHGAELDLAPTLAALQAQGRRVLLPRLLRLGKRMEFRVHAAGAALGPNRFGIGEPPRSAARVAPGDLDVVLLPLVAFDAEGGRLGTGGGYYDRCFAFRRDLAHPRRPLLIGVGFDCQQVADIPPGAWDVPLDLVVTESRVIGAAGPA